MQTVTIDTKMKEMYYKHEAIPPTEKEIAQNNKYWNYMFNISIQNITFHREKKSAI